MVTDLIFSVLIYFSNNALAKKDFSLSDDILCTETSRQGFTSIPSSS